MQKFWEEGCVPHDDKDANSIQPYKIKDVKAFCDHQALQPLRL